MKKKVVKKKSNSVETKSTETVSDNKDVKDEQPGIFHYVVVLVVLFLIIFGISFIVDLFKESSSDLDDVKKEKYYYGYVRGNVTYNLELGSSEESIRQLDYSIETSRLDILNVVDFRFSFDQYNGSDNAPVSVSSIKLRRFLDTVYFFNFDLEDFSTLDKLTCLNSTKSNRVVTFEINATENGVFVDENYCINFKSKSPEELVSVVDYFMITIVEDE